MAGREPPKPYAAPVHPLPGPGGSAFRPAGERSDPEDEGSRWAFDGTAGDETETDFPLDPEDERARRERLAAPSARGVVVGEERARLVTSAYDAILRQEPLVRGAAHAIAEALAERLGCTVEEAGAELDAERARRRAREGVYLGRDPQC